ncbi:Uncharacterized protein TCM_035553 [Theobroma cacao]|uniref:Uncharacterized protein n=1 Tax=Theobroma cacao TaxID=3641 RepID=A0A061FI43_THECC|nr:Uncharacterized protein TCM_035553 [Theobroma cacao]
MALIPLVIFACALMPSIEITPSDANRWEITSVNDFNFSPVASTLCVICSPLWQARDLFSTSGFALSVI